jgi:hypothetical protein
MIALILALGLAALLYVVLTSRSRRRRARLGLARGCRGWRRR